MAISAVLSILPGTIDAILAARDALQRLQTQRGDLMISDLSAVLNAMGHARRSTVELLREGAKRPAAANRLLSDMGLPSTLAQFRDAMLNVNAKAEPFYEALQQMRDGMPPAQLLTLTRFNPGTPQETRAFTFAQFIPAQHADAFRDSVQVADLLAALNALEV